MIDAIKNWYVSIIRTAVPFVVATIAGYLATRHVNLDDHTLRVLTLTIEGLAGMSYYMFVRALEHLQYRWGWLLGYAKMPTYIVTPATAGLSYPEQVNMMPVIHTPTGDPLDDLYKDEIDQGPVPRMGQ